MFYDQITGRFSRLGEGAHKVLLAKRDRIYTKWVRNEETNKWEEVFVAKGWEIVQELTVTAEGEKMWNSWENDQRWLFIKTNYPHLIEETEESETKPHVE